jgi:DNA-binding response OmpR family regulator
VPSVLILDVGLPDMTAFELVQELRKNPATSGMNLIVHTTLDLSTKEQAKLMLGTTMFITKATACSFALAESVFKLARQQSDPGAK